MEELEYCRLCLRRNLRLIAISKNVQETFRYLTEMDLIKVLGLSSLICQLCERQLKNAKNYREKLLQSETKLQNELKSSLHQNNENESMCSLAIERVINTDDLITEEVFDLIEDEMMLEKFENELAEIDVIESKEQELEENEESPSEETFDKPANVMPNQETFKHPADPLKIDKRSKLLKIANPAVKIPLDIIQSSIDGKVICPHCNKTVIKSYIKHHIARLHFNIKNYTCDFCDKQFYKRSAIDNHMNTHLNAKPFGCSDCNKLFASKTALSTHIRFHHTSFHKYICEGCGKAYKQKRLLEEHCRSQHTGERIFKCHFENCDSAFFSNGAIRKHLQRSHKSQPETETCEFCGKNFKNLSNLQAHMRLAHSNVIVVCEFPGCGKQFANRCYLENHKKCHDPTRGFQCEFCQKVFARKRHMIRHVETAHLKSQNIQCQVDNCRKILTRKEIYRNHLKKIHKHLTSNEIEDLINDTKKVEEIIEYLDYEILDDDDDMIEEEILME